MSIAFSRARLLDEVDSQAVERAKKLGKRLVKQNWNGESFDAVKDRRKPSTQSERIRNITDLCREDTRTKDEIVEETGMDESKVEHEIGKLKDKGELYEPTQGEYKAL